MSETLTREAARLFASLAQTPAVRLLRQRLEQGGVLSLDTVHPAAHPFFAVLLLHLFPRKPVVVVTADLKIQESYFQDTATWLGATPDSGNFQSGPSYLPHQPIFYPAWEILPHEAKLPHADVISDRLETLGALLAAADTTDRASALVITTVAALLQRTFPPARLRQRTRTVQRGDRLDPLDLVEWLEAQAYEPEARVTQKGELALRGGILDLFPLTSPWPVRLEFFGNELESLRCFDPLTQISREEIDRIVLPPAGELGLLRKWVVAEHAAADASSILATLLDYLPPETTFLLCEPARLESQASQYAAQIPPGDPFFVSWADFQAQIAARGMTRLSVEESILSGEIPSLTSPLEGAAPSAPISPPPLAPLSFSSLDLFRPLGAQAPEPRIAETQRREFFAQLHRWLRQNYAVHLFCNNEGERQRFWEIWQEYGLDQQPSQRLSSLEGAALSAPISPPPLATHLGALSRGFLFEAARLVVVTDAEIFGRYKVQRPRRLKSPHAAATRSALDIDFADLEGGDYVVHLQYGIGRYLGLGILPAAPPKHGDARDIAPPASREPGGQECLILEYAPSGLDQSPPRLYVPIHQAHLVSKYVGTGKARPPLNTLGGTRWAKTKAQAENAVRDLAADLLSLQALRAIQPGHAFPADTPWQREFESAFVYEETPDQMRAIIETKADLEMPKPMDRLICGDVGYGKTEVAIRAAFKAVMGGKQAVVLVPTTVLAQQHFNTFRERMADYPIRIELLSRFRSRREQQRVLADLVNGGVDIVIGTHRLVQSDVAFKDLGLVVIDEEQRFGVVQKEKLKQLRRLVDVLTLSATPIPRTLHLALSGARDMSTIETPPQDRLPVETIVTPFDERTIRDAIQRELNRAGQVFYLHNRVFDIDAVAARLKMLVPQARLVVGHGQMPDEELEDVMTRFVNGDADVLLSTTIIESGLDIPNANTIIIDRADRFGLSDLYQLRGRVGRYKHQAYAYLLLPRHADLLTDARKRISAIKQYSSLGSGFKIAMRDLEIRGAGNLLGPQQSGHIAAVGFELYCQLLKQNVTALKGKAVTRPPEVSVRLDFLTLAPPASGMEGGKGRGTAARRRGEGAADMPGQKPIAAAYLPATYIPDPAQRVEIHRRLAQAADAAVLALLYQEAQDRFGPPPPPVALLWQVARLKLTAAGQGITAIETRGDRLILTRNYDFVMVRGKFPRLTAATPKARLDEIRRLLLTL